ncbi:solute carrier organic anion transporter family member 2A1 isoform X2 [Chelonus insularis]|nr:solute carrier organic anion transporter family member 2A1-like isoform X2 [Chelonus insularis]
MRSDEVEGQLSGPAHPIPDQSLDCGCGQMRCPKLVKYAPRNFYVGLICWIGAIQGAAQAYFGLTSPVIVRRFNFPPDILEWFSLFTDGLIPLILALPIAYWGDRIHRAAWTGALILIQSVGFLTLIIPHFTHNSSRVIEETTNTTHLSIYAEDHPELCAVTGLARVSVEEDEICYFTLLIIIISQILNWVGNIAYFALGISYLDDNTRKRHVAIPLSFIIAFKLIGMFFGYLLAWGCLQIDADDVTLKVASYREQIGGWWIGWPILAFLLALPGIPVALLPRRLPSEIVEQAAASILDLAGRTSPISESTISGDTKKFGDTGYFASLIRLFTNKILMFNILASAFCIAALVNFAINEDIFLESRFYVPRPSGLLLGFGDPLTSRVVTILLRPIIIGTFIIISGIVIVKMRPRAKWLVIYNIIVGIIAASIIFSLAFNDCKKPPIEWSNSRGSISLLKYCNRNCRCLNDANFRPICNIKSSSVFYTPCHAGCTSIDDSGDIRKYLGCSCIENNEAIEGPCESSICQIGWIVFEISTIIVYTLIASGAVSCAIIGLRSVYIQDKALAIGLWIVLTSFFTYLPGKMLYWKLTDITCIHRGNSPSSCHLYDSESLGSYLAWLTALLLLFGVSFEIIMFFFSRNLRLYRESEIELNDINQAPTQAIPLVEQPIQQQNPQDGSSSPEIDTTLAVVTTTDPEPQPATSTDAVQTSAQSSKNLKENGPLKYGPLGPGSPRKTQILPTKEANTPISDSEDTDSEQIHNRRAPISLSTISYKRLEVDSDEISDSSMGSSRRIHSLKASSSAVSRVSSETPSLHAVAGFSATDDIQFTKFPKKKKDFSYSGDFNEVGIPIVEYPLTSMNSRSIGSILASSKSRDQIKKFQMKQENYKNKDGNAKGDTSRPLSPEYASSGFESSTSDAQKVIDQKPSMSGKNISKSTSNLPNPKPKIYGYTTAL